ncbi:MAG TPA: hypothetical protein VM536_08860 [Chloroflexia bacterium]|nr:hypothetical protein [Chloroflexia bacterium]
MPTRRLRLLAAGLLMGLLAACDVPGQAPDLPTPIVVPTAMPAPTHARPSPTPEPTAVSLDDVQVALQAVVAAEREAVLADSQDAYMSQIDSGDREWRKFQEAEFVNDSDLTGRLSCVSNVRLAADGTTAQADVSIDDCPGRYHQGMFFRLVNNRWLHSQPGRDEQGPRDTRKIGPFRVTFHAMDESSLDALGRFAPDIYDHVSTMMDTRQLDVDVDLVSRPTDMPRGAFTTIALYNPSIARMTVLSPFYWANGDGTEADLDDQIRVTLAHEFTHHAVRTLALTRVPHWLNEGMAVYVSGENPARYDREVQQLAALDHLQPPEVLDELLLSGDTAGISYDEGYSFVHYLAGKQGDAVLPKLLRSLRETGNLDQSLTQVTGKGLAAWWKAWVKSLGD